MPTNPTADQRRTIAKILGMCGSSFDGEVAAAGRAAEAVRKSIGCDWFAICGGAAPDEAQLDRLRAEVRQLRWERDTARDRLRDAQSELDKLHAPKTGIPLFLEVGPTRHLLSDWDRTFLQSVHDQRSRGKSLSPKQVNKLDEIAKKCAVSFTGYGPQTWH